MNQNMNQMRKKLMFSLQKLNFLLINEHSVLMLLNPLILQAALHTVVCSQERKHKSLNCIIAST